MKKWKEITKITSIPVLIASLCCLSPVILVLLGLSTTAFASSLADTLYGDYKWVFRGVGLVLLAGALWYHFRKRQKICTLDQAKKRRREIINTVLMALIVGIIAYVLWLYVGVHYIGVWLDLWEQSFCRPVEKEGQVTPLFLYNAGTNHRMIPRS